MQHVSTTLVNFFTRVMQVYFSKKRSIPTKIIMFPVVWVLLNVGSILYAFSPPEKEVDEP